MGRTGSSSKRKSSKKKISKISSEARRKRSSGKIKSKKLRRHDDSVSSYSDDESSSSLSISSSSSGDDYRSRKSRSRTRGHVKGSRKRVRRSSSSRGCSTDSPHVKKKKRKADSESRKKRSKKKKKKKLRRGASISSASSDTRSCSTCQGGSNSGSEERDPERLRGRSIERKKHKRNSGKGRSVARKSRDRSRSCSSCSKLSDSVGNNTIELFTVESNSRRLRSVISVVTRAEEREGNEESKDELKEEIVYDHDDYPSCRSNDSNDGGNKKESAQRTVENVIGEEPSVSNLISLKPTLASNGGDKYDALDRSLDGVGSVSPKEKEGDVKELELILRQRALENLKRFRGGRQINELVSVDEKNKSNSEMKPLSTAETEFVQKEQAAENLKIFRGGRQTNVVIVDEKNESNYEMKPLSTGEAEFVQNNQLKQEDPGITGVSQSAVRRSRFTWRRNSSLPTGTEEKIPPEKHGGTDPATAKHGGSEEKDINIRPLASRLQTLPRAISSLTDSANKSADKTSRTLAESSSNTRDIGNGDACGPTVLEAPSSLLPEEGSSREQQNEAKDGSQFEQKTMSVMRGGEMVQVSYKVYIPKKAPALARRQLKR